MAIKTLLLVITLLAAIITFSPVTGDIIETLNHGATSVFGNINQAVCQSKSWVTGSTESCEDDHDKVTADKTGKILEGIETGTRAQSRFKFTKPNLESVAGIKDMNLGKVRNGAKIGNPVIRFDSGAKTGHAPHINLDPRGYPRSNNPHLYIPKTMVNSAYYAQKTLQKTGSVLTFLTIVTDAFRLGSAAKLDYEEYRQTGEITSKVEQCTVETNQDSQGCIRHSEGIKAKQSQKRNFIPANSIKEGSSILGGWTGGYLGGYAGAKVGGATGGIVGSVLGPPGAMVGSVLGAVGGSLYGAVTGANYVSEGAKTVAETILEDEASREQISDLPKNILDGVTGAVGYASESAKVVAEKVIEAAPSKEQLDDLQKTVLDGAFGLYGFASESAKVVAEKVAKDGPSLVPSKEQLADLQNSVVDGVLGVVDYFNFGDDDHHDE